jgi:hypothetical protein
VGDSNPRRVRLYIQTPSSDPAHSFAYQAAQRPQQRCIAPPVFFPWRPVSAPQAPSIYHATTISKSTLGFGWLVKCEAALSTMRTSTLPDAKLHFLKIWRMRTCSLDDAKNHFVSFLGSARVFLVYFCHRFLAAFLRCSSRRAARHLGISVLRFINLCSSIPSQLCFSII